MQGQDGVVMRADRPVVSCSEYVERDAPSLRAMQTIAWYVTSDKRGRIGFTPYGHLPRMDLYDLRTDQGPVRLPDDK